MQVVAVGNPDVQKGMSKFDSKVPFPKFTLSQDEGSPIPNPT